ncbi:MAG TPA: hypothetical protein ENF84_03090 [Chloroflexi bacterium]|nr:hypothetical protein [Chloroflexota bacterium]
MANLFGFFSDSATCGRARGLKVKRERPLIIIWLDNLGAFHQFLGESKNIADAFAGGTLVKHLISVVPSVTETAELTIKAGCGLEEMPVVGEVTFDRETQALLHLKETARFDDLVGPGLVRRLFTSFGFRTCQIGWKLGGVGAPNVLSIESEEAVRLELEGSYDIIPFRINSFIEALAEHEADIYLLNISGDSIVHNEAEAGQRNFMRRLDEEFPRLMAAIRAHTLEPTIIMFSDHGPKPIEEHLRPEEFLEDVEGLVFQGENRNAAVVSNGRGPLFVYVKNPRDDVRWRKTSYRELRDYQGKDILAAIAAKEDVAFVASNLEEGGISILSRDGEARLSEMEGGFLYQIVAGADPLGLGEVEGRVVSAEEMLARTYDKEFPHPIQLLKLLQSPRCSDIFVVLEHKYSFFWDYPWVKTTHGGPSRPEITVSLLAVGPKDEEAGIVYGRELEYGWLAELYNSLCRILYRGKSPHKGIGGDLLFGGER